MEKEEKSKNKNGLLVGALVFIIVMLLALVYLFATDKIILNKENISSTNNTEQNTVTEDKTTTEEIDYESIAIERFKEMIVIEHSWNYVGNRDKNDNYTEEGEQYYRYYVASSTFSSKASLKEHLSTILSDELISSKFDIDTYCVDKNSKLYCQVSMKDCGPSFIYEESSITENMISITNKTDTSFNASLKLDYTTGCETTILTLNATMKVNKINNNWIITEYKDDFAYSVKY